jgi:hypothetical protein
MKMHRIDTDYARLTVATAFRASNFFGNWHRSGPGNRGSASLVWVIHEVTLQRKAGVVSLQTRLKETAHL